jgi:hypothetical protein
MTWLTITEYLCHKWSCLCSVCRNHNHILSYFMTYYCLYLSETRRMLLVKQKLFTLPEHINSPLFYRSWCWSIFSFMCSVLWIVGCSFVNFLLAIVLSVDLCLSFVNCHCVHLRFTASDYSFGILRLFLLNCSFILFLWRIQKYTKYGCW